MNEFTKEELEEIKRCLKYMINGGTTPYSCVTMDSKDKIQSMIDNYQCDDNCSSHELVRLKLKSQKEYDFCETCLYVRRMR